MDTPKKNSGLMKGILIVVAIALVGVGIWLAVRPKANTKSAINVPPLIAAKSSGQPITQTTATETGVIAIKEWGIGIKNNKDKTLGYVISKDGKSAELTSSDLPVKKDGICSNKLGISIVQAKPGDKEHGQAITGTTINGHIYYVNGAPADCGDLSYKRVLEATTIAKEVVEVK